MHHTNAHSASAASLGSEPFQNYTTDGMDKLMLLFVKKREVKYVLKKGK